MFKVITEFTWALLNVHTEPKFFQGFGGFSGLYLLLKRFKVSYSKESVCFSNCTHGLAGQQYTLAVECLRNVIHKL